MALGPGIYDDICTLVRESTHARGAIVIVLDGQRGSGFSVQTTENIGTAELAKTLKTLSELLLLEA